jgi:hypothetical protein
VVAADVACANQRFFDDSNTRAEQERYARGWDSRKGKLTGGITFPIEDKVRCGGRLYRFGHAEKTDEENFSSPWWMRQETFTEIVARALRTGASLSDMNRIKNAVAHDFGSSGVIFVVELLQDLRVFSGRGRPVQESGQMGGVKDRILLGGVEIAQLFIPGLRDFTRRGRSDIAHAAMRIVRSEPASAYFLNQASRNRAGLAALDRDLPPGGRVPR